MRDAYFRALTELGARDERVWALTGDLGIGLFDPFQEVAPGRYLNVGIAEQNLVGVAAGLAYAGKLPFAYSIAPFMTSRPHDQIRVDVALPGANVKLVGVGGGVAYGTLGPTHHAIEDIALMRALPGLTVLTPGDPNDAYLATLAAAGPIASSPASIVEAVAVTLRCARSVVALPNWSVNVFACSGTIRPAARSMAAIGSCGEKVAVASAMLTAIRTTSAESTFRSWSDRVQCV